MSVSTLDGSDATKYSALQLLELAKEDVTDATQIFIILMDDDGQYHGAISNMTMAHRSYSLTEALTDVHIPDWGEDDE